MDAFQLQQLISMTPLLEPVSSLAGIHSSFIGSAVNGSLYFGTGITTPKAMSAAVPFDILGMLLVAEKIRRGFGLNHIFHLIADTHAKSNEFVTNDMADEATERLLSVCKRIAITSGFSDYYSPMKSSDISQTPEYLEIYERINTADHEYVRREWSDIEFMRRHLNVQLKLSWTVGRKVNKVGFDERLYDLRYRDVSGQIMSFIYMNAGRTFDKNRPKVSPYISIAGENRILLQPGEDVKKKFTNASKSSDERQISQVETQLGFITGIFEEIHGFLPYEQLTVLDKAQKIVDLIFS